MKNFIHIIEIIVWVAIISALIWLAGDYLYSLKHEKKLVTVAFDDVDGLEIGAPVRFMGVEIGSIKQLDLKNDKVDVTFSLKNPDFQIPDDSTVTIQFTGLVGSKTLEIEPPKIKTTLKEKLIVVNPIRISSFVEMNAKTQQSIASGSKNFLRVFGEGTMLRVKENIHDVNIITHDAVIATDKVRGIIKKARITFVNALVNVNSSLDNHNVTTKNIISSLKSRDYDEDTLALLRVVKLTLKYFYLTLTQSNYKRTLNDFIYAGNSINKRLDRSSIEYFINLDINNFMNKLDKFNARLFDAAALFNKINLKLENFDADKFFNMLLNKTGEIKGVTSKMEEAI